jgi:hypothetical protein
MRRERLIIYFLIRLQVTGMGYLAASYDLFNILFLVSQTTLNLHIISLKNKYALILLPVSGD